MSNQTITITINDINIAVDELHSLLSKKIADRRVEKAVEEVLSARNISGTFYDLDKLYNNKLSVASLNNLCANVSM